jgi:hypothetical protein
MAGTRGGLGRIAAMVIGLAVVLVLVLAGAARAGTYRVAQCGWGVGTELAPVEAGFQNGFVTDLCLPLPGVEAGIGLITQPTSAGGERIARAIWTAPSGTAITAARVVWSGTLQSLTIIQLGNGEGGGFRPYASHTAVLEESVLPQAFAATLPAPARSVEVRMECLMADVEMCVEPFPSRVLLREVTLTLDDPTPPHASLGGAPPAGGWERGTVGLTASAEDAGAGVDQLEARVDGTPLVAAPVACATATIEGELRATALRPCPATAAASLQLDTTEIADGAHRLAACGMDFAGNVGCADEVALDVDNSPPALEFISSAAGGIAVAVRDTVSGPAAGSIAVRRADSGEWEEVPSELHPSRAGEATLRATLPALDAGTYIFRATARDAAGNEGSTSLLLAGSAAEIRRQAGEGHGPDGGSGPARRHGAAAAGTNLTAYLRPGRGGPHGERGGGSHGGPRLTVPFGTGVEVRGHLTGHDRRGIAGRRVRVAVHPADGATAPASVHRLTTGRDGGFALSLPPGTSRRVVVSFAGGHGLDGAHPRPLELKVGAGVSLAARPTSLRTEQTLDLTGRVRRGAARIGSRGKLVAIQYLERATGRWRPALVVRTDTAGRFHTRYRFRYITGDARIRLRATAPAEGGWPYAAGSSAPVTVRVHGA